jgi:hypothetical protein
MICLTQCGKNALLGGCHSGNLQIVNLKKKIVKSIDQAHQNMI